MKLTMKILDLEGNLIRLMSFVLLVLGLMVKEQLQSGKLMTCTWKQERELLGLQVPQLGKEELNYFNVVHFILKVHAR